MPTLRLRPDLEDALSRIHSVRATSVVTLADGQPSEIHVLATPGKHAKQVVRDVQSLAMAQFGLDVDHRIISVVQLDDESLAPAAPAEPAQPQDAPATTPDASAAAPNAATEDSSSAGRGEPTEPEARPWEQREVIDLREREPVSLSVVGTERASANGRGHQAAARVMVLPEALAAESASDEEPAPRPSIASIMVRTSNGESEATVSVGAGGHVFEGRMVGPAGASHRPSLVSRATLAALADLLGQAAEIESAQIVGAGPRAVAVTVLTVQTPRIGEQVVSGSAIVRGDEADAVARSVLDALNRRISG